ncbi:protein S40-7 [Ziziphus jujuba]|uniref:Protein S40-7 n=2 Tax=Ziziphus jujuba TaxID=326968 RepID=A0ABM3I5I1_ZIZJJ|nr:protein S40-7 [Ziziphus jujuba]KAH7512193.1 hypothetical protein FEM48_Zijuj12G0064500 [Ziziphus jujuba var. spinosa]
MDSTAYRHRRSPASDRFLTIFSFSPPSSAIATGGDELVEAEVFWTNDFIEQNQNQNPHGSTLSRSSSNLHSFDVDHPKNSGILAVLPEPPDHGPQTTLYHKPSLSSSSRLIPVIPRPPQNQGSQDKDYSQSAPSAKFHKSAPMNVPVLSKAMETPRKTQIFFVDDDDGDDEILPPHEIVARGSGMSPKTTFSVLEGVGRTLKGRDLRQVRNAIWRKTGFLD